MSDVRSVLLPVSLICWIKMKNCGLKSSLQLLRSFSSPCVTPWQIAAIAAEPQRSERERRHEWWPSECHIMLPFRFMITKKRKPGNCPNITLPIVPWFGIMFESLKSFSFLVIAIRLYLWGCLEYPGISLISCVDAQCVDSVFVMRGITKICIWFGLEWDSPLVCRSVVRFPLQGKFYVQ